LTVVITLDTILQYTL